jgi:uncharacterized membrane protein YqhA
MENEPQGLLERVFEFILFNTRFLTIIAVISSLIASAMMFIKGGILVYQGTILMFHHMANISEVSLSDNIVATFISSVDNFLFATVLLIFSMGLYELFVSKIDPAGRTENSRPNWLNITSLDDLKGYLGKVILMILIVSFFEKSLEIEFKTALDLVYLGIGIALVSLALFLTHAGQNHHKE